MSEHFPSDNDPIRKPEPEKEVFSDKYKEPEESIAERIRSKLLPEMQEGARAQERAELLEQATQDALTGIKNRRGFEESLEAVAKLRRDETMLDSIVIMLIDIDHFKKINDEHGHPIGDEVLKAVAKQLAKLVREEDIVARWGGEEFVIAFMGADEKTILAKFGMDRKEKKPAQLKIEDVEVEGEVFPITVSAGLSTFPHKKDFTVALNESVEEADRALYTAKQSGRNRLLSFKERLPS